MKTETKFPADFLWGTATASYQVEGAWNEDGKRPSIWDDYCHSDNKRVFQRQNADVAIDEYHRYKEDVAYIKKLNCNAYRFSVSWARILPEGTGKVNEKGVEYYDNLINELIKNGIKPVITLFHWDLPLCLQQKGGFVNREILSWFEEYAKVCFERFGDRVDYWITINEPTVFAFSGYMLGVVPPCIKDYAKAFLAAHHALLAHGRTVRLFRKMNLKGKIGFALDIIPKFPAKDTEEDRRAARLANVTTQYFFYEAVVYGRYPSEALKFFSERGADVNVSEEDMNCIGEKCDFFGFNYYLTQTVEYEKGNGIADCKYVFCRGLPVAPQSQWEIDPNGLYDLLKKITEDIGPDIPIIITENGICYEDKVLPDGSINDEERKEYVRVHLEAIRRALADGINIKGYFNWTAFDNFEWNNGFSTRFGMIYVDFVTQQRTIKKSGEFYAEYIKENTKKV